jgi:hypothetical protein
MGLFIGALARCDAREIPRTAMMVDMGPLSFL